MSLLIYFCYSVHTYMLQFVIFFSVIVMRSAQLSLRYTFLT